ncbi:MAG: type II toxin-antitoxin system RelE/ParE family toxin [Syntrophobacteraceae bacterium]
MYGFPKSAKANLNGAELDAYHRLAQIYLSFDAASINRALSEGALEEVICHGQEISE